MKIIGVPRISALGKKGPEEAPRKILEELGVEGEEISVGNDDIAEDGRRIFSEARRAFKKDERVVFIGGDHSITYPTFKAFSEENENAFLVVFDAHADCMPPMREPTHEEFLRAVVEGGFSPENVVLVGARKLEDVEGEFLKKEGIKVFRGDFDSKDVMDYIFRRTRGKQVYVSVDIDVLDSKFAPAVNYPEPKGLLLEGFLHLLEEIFSLKEVRVLDIVEVVPEKDRKYDFRTVKAAARIITEFMRT